MSVLRFVRDVVSFAAVMAMLYGWTLLGHAAGL